MLVLMGSKDEAFSPEATKEAVLEYSNGEIQIIENASHNGIKHNIQSFTYIKDWFSTL